MRHTAAIENDEATVGFHVERATFHSLGCVHFHTHFTPECSEATPVFLVQLGGRPGHHVVEVMKESPTHVAHVDRSTTGLVRQRRGVVGRPVHVESETDDHEARPRIRDRTGLGQDPGHFACAVGPEQIVRPFERRLDPSHRHTRSCGGHGHRVHEGARIVGNLTKKQADQEVLPHWSLPTAVETTLSGRLMIGPQRRAIGSSGLGHGPQVGVRAAGGRHVMQDPVADDLGCRVTESGVTWFHGPTLSLVSAKVTPKPLTKILIANRGEIAVRVIRAAREMGIATVAVYSELDRNALHVRLADEAYALGGQTAAESYLNTEAILDAIRTSGADGVHPGYGFFSENADFADAITEMGVAFIGPPGDAIREMGDKVSSRKAALRGGAPIVPGTTEFVTTADEIRKFGEDFGWPIAIKAAFGGGGRGMKVVKSAADVQEAMDSAQREAKAFFGRDEIYVEKYLTWPRHVEVQLVGDQHGNYVWVSTRDCSAQRRHQKLVEEAPAPALPDGVEDAMGEAAVKAAKAVGYFNAGTVEFIYQDGEFFFLEMNTRLQVEHPVTEVITGIDLVEWQIRVAGGEKLPMTQKQVAARRYGHGIEIRINAENPAGGKFLPSPGPITKLSTSDGFGVRFDSGYEAGDEISQYYDNLVGKLIVWGKDRPTAIARTIRALEEMVVEGVATTIPADIAILRHPDFAAVTHSTKWVEEVLDLSGVEAPVAPAAGDDEAPLVRRNTTVEVNGKRFDVAMWVPDQPMVAVAGGAKAAKKPARASSGGGAAGGGSGEVAAPMQGTIVKVLVEVGATVEAGQAVVVLEAMKMENQIQADKAGTVKEVKVAAGDTVGGGDVLVVIE